MNRRCGFPSARSRWCARAVRLGSLPLPLPTLPHSFFPAEAKPEQKVEKKKSGSFLRARNKTPEKKAPEPSPAKEEAPAPPPVQEPAPAQEVAKKKSGSFFGAKAKAPETSPAPGAEAIGSAPDPATLSLAALASMLVSARLSVAGRRCRRHYWEVAEYLALRTPGPVSHALYDTSLPDTPPHTNTITQPPPSRKSRRRSRARSSSREARAVRPRSPTPPSSQRPLPRRTRRRGAM